MAADPAPAPDPFGAPAPRRFLDLPGFPRIAYAEAGAGARLRLTAEARHDDDVDLRMAEEPQDVLVEDRIAAAARIAFARSWAGTSRHVANAFRAAATARSTSFGDASGNVATTSSVTGEITVSLPPPLGFSHLPPMKNESGCLIEY